MKRLLILIAFSFSLLTLSAQTYYAPMRAPQGAKNTVVKLPAEVQVEFKLQFPKATDVYWEQEYGATYTASFIDTTVINVTYDSVGQMQYAEAQMTAKQLPQAITKDINKRYPGWDINSARLITDHSGNKKYNALVQKSDKNNSYEITYDARGSFICSSPPLPKYAQ